MIFLLSAHPNVDLINVGPLLVLLAYILGGCAGIIRRMERRWLLVKEREPLSDLVKSISGKGAFAKIHRTEGFLILILSEITLEQLYHTPHMEG